MHVTNYPTNLTDKQWQVMEKYLDSQKRMRKHSLREIFNALLYLFKTSCQWRMLPLDFPKWKLLYYFYSRRYMEITLLSNKKLGFKPLPKRWIVERTFTWLENFRRLAKDYEYTVSLSVSMVLIAFITLAFNNIS